MNMKKVRKRANNGITLIALVITIIVLLILAGVTIATLTGDNGILIQVGKAEEETRGASVQEARDLWKINQEADNQAGESTAQSLEKLIEDLVNQKLLTEDEKDQILGNDSKGIEATYKVKIGSRIIGFKEKYIEDYLETGKYVYYPQENGEPIKCIVLYDKDYNMEKRQDYGVQIIAADTVEDITIGYKGGTINSSSDIDMATSLYNNIITTLNTRAMTYLNKTYASNARCVGTAPDNPELEASDYFTSSESYFSKINGKLKNQDQNYTTDVKRMQELKINNIGKYYWLASRTNFYWGTVESGAFHYDFHIRAIDDRGSSSYRFILEVYGNGTVFSNGRSTCGLRPVFTLKPSVYIIDGVGTENDPYVLRI